MMKIGAIYNGDGSASFTVWAPFRKSVAVKFSGNRERTVQMERHEYGYFKVNNVAADPGDRYTYVLDNSIEHPDPASFLQPEGVHKPSELLDHSAYRWHDSSWGGIPLQKMIIYESHTGVFTPQGTFDAVGEKLDYLIDLGVTALELMPVAQFPGGRNWGYDGAYPFAVQNSYGGPERLKNLVDLCHRKGLALILDVVYNHLGPEGTYVADFGPYFTSKYSTPWGDAINYDDSWSDGVRNFFVQNVFYWFEHYHIDALRLDAIQGIFDFGAKHILQEMAEETETFSRENGRKRYLIAESDLNDIRVITSLESNGYGVDAQWTDDFHHSVHTLLTGENKSYYGDYGSIENLAKAFKEGFVYSWDFSSNRKRHHGSSSAHIEAKQHVVCIQNHDQIGNRLMGERLSMVVPFEAARLAAGAMFVSPYIPLLFMGEEFAPVTPFLYFISHSDKNLVQAVREGRAREFADLHMGKEPPDPQDPHTFIKCRLDWDSISSGVHAASLAFYKEMILLRKSIPALSNLDKNSTHVDTFSNNKLLVLKRWHQNSSIAAIMNFSPHICRIEKGMVNFPGHKIIDSCDPRFCGSGSLMPQKIEEGREYEVPGYGFILYKGE